MYIHWDTYCAKSEFGTYTVLVYKLYNMRCIIWACLIDHSIQYAIMPKFVLCTYYVVSHVRTVCCHAHGKGSPILRIVFTEACTYACTYIRSIPC